MSLKPSSVEALAWKCAVPVKKEWEEETDGQQDYSVYMKKEPQLRGDQISSLKCHVKEETDIPQEHSIDVKVEPAWSDLQIQSSFKYQVKEELEEKIYRLEEYSVHVIDQPEWKRDIQLSLKCDMKEKSEMLDLYGEHKWEVGIRLGPECLQPPHSTTTKSGQVSTAESSHRPGDVDGSKNTPLQHQICVKKFAHRSLFEEHLKLHSVDTPHEINQSPPISIAKHDRFETPKGPYSCDVCTKKFRVQNKLIRHRKTHTYDRHYSCNVCMRKMSSKEYLEEHYRSHTGENPYSCDVCMKQFTRKNHLDKHKRTHTGEKPFSCDVCTKQFSILNNLVRHKQTHTGEKPYSCDVCMKQFSTKNNLDRHGLTHAVKKDYSCDECSIQFRNMNALRSRKKLHIA